MPMLNIAELKTMKLIIINDMEKTLNIGKEKQYWKKISK